VCQTFNVVPSLAAIFQKRQVKPPRAADATRLMLGVVPADVRSETVAAERKRECTDDHDE
jgi:hypothetical protein